MSSASTEICDCGMNFMQMKRNVDDSTANSKLFVYGVPLDEWTPRCQFHGSPVRIRIRDEDESSETWGAERRDWHLESTSSPLFLAAWWCTDTLQFLLTCETADDLAISRFFSGSLVQRVVEIESNYWPSYESRARHARKGHSKGPSGCQIIVEQSSQQIRNRIPHSYAFGVVSSWNIGDSNLSINLLQLSRCFVMVEAVCKNSWQRDRRDFTTILYRLGFVE